jgi:hypothetical protein
MSVTKDDIRKKLDKYIIRKGMDKDIPDTLEGEILLEKVYDKKGNYLGVITVSVDNFYNLFKDIFDDPKITKKLEHIKKNKQETGYHKYIEKWQKEGIDF